MFRAATIALHILSRWRSYGLSRWQSHGYNIEYHFVWVTKYRDKVLTGDVALRVRELVRQTCEIFEIKILTGVVRKDHVHILVSAPPHMAPSEIMRRSKNGVRASCSRSSHC